MSHVDTKAEFSAAQAVTATAISTNVMDLRGAGLSPNTLQSIGAPAMTYLVITQSAAATAVGAATVTFSLESATDAGLTTGAVVHYQSGAIGKAALTAGARTVCVPLPADSNYKEFLGIRYTVATGPLTAGAFNAFLTLDPNMWRAFEDAVPG